MRRLLLSVLLATSVALPAMAQDGGERDRGDREASSEQRNEARAARRAERAERPERVERERPEAVDGGERSTRVQARRQALQEVSEPQIVRQRGFEQREEARAERRVERAARGDVREGERHEGAEQQVQRADRQITAAAPGHNDNRSGSGHRDYHRDARRDHGDLHASDPTRREHRQYHRDGTRDHRTEHRSWDGNGRRAGHGEYHRDADREHRDLHASDPTRREHRDGHRDIARQHDRRHSAWDTNWRNSQSYDWRGYRGRNSSLYDLSNYYDPYRNGYRRFSIGVSLWPSYYSSRYWLDDPWQYRLPPAYGPYRWVRYYNDALLVNVTSGQVVDVVHGFFW